MSPRINYPTLPLTFTRARYIHGSLTKKTVKDFEGNPLPEEKQHFWTAYAVEKANPETQAHMAAIYQHVRASYAAGGPAAAGIVAQIDQWLTATAFAWKIVDGDTHPKWSKREGAAGCFVIFVKSNFATTCFDPANKPLTAEAFRAGDYVDLGVSIEINGKPGGTAGIYINPTALRWREEGPQISIGADADTIFGAAIGPGYTRPLPTAGAPTSPPAAAGPSGYPGQTMTPAPAGVPGVAGAAPGAPGHYGAVPSPANMNQPAGPYAVNALTPVANPATYPDAALTADGLAARYQVQHYPGYRFDPTTRGYVPDVAPPAAPPAMAPSPQPSVGYPPVAGHPGTPMPPAGPVIGAYPSSPPVHAGGPVAPAGVPGGYPAPSGVPGGQPATAYPSSPAGIPPGVQPHPGFVGT